MSFAKTMESLQATEHAGEAVLVERELHLLMEMTLKMEHELQMAVREE